MASKKSGPGPEGTARVRFIMLEADVSNGNLTDFAATIASALKSSSHQRVLASAPSQAKDGATSETLSADDEEAAEFDVQSPVADVTPKPSRPRKSVISKVKVIDLDLNSPLSLEQYALTKSADSVAMKFLVVAAWFKEHRNIDSITADHVYTCFKKLSWSAAKDMTQPFRDQKKIGRGDYQDGKFSINHIGLDVVQKMGRADG